MLHDAVLFALIVLAGYGAWRYDQWRLTVGKPNRNTYRLSEVKTKLSDTLGGEQISFETDDGQTFTIEHPMFRSKTTKQALEPLNDNDTDGIARALLGDDQWEKFSKAGGDGDDINALLMAVGMNMQDQSQGKPARFSTSSGSGPKQ